MLKKMDGLTRILENQPTLGASFFVHYIQEKGTEYQSGQHQGVYTTMYNKFIEQLINVSMILRRN